MNSWIKKDLEYNWHPFTQMKDCQKLPPVLIEKARGVKLYDARGKFYYDTISSWWCNVHGHNHPQIKEAIRKQLDRLEHVLFAGFTHKPAIGLAEKLVALAPGNLSRVFFSDDGSTAVEVALKMSFQYWQNKKEKTKSKFVSLDLGYHGDTIGAMSVSGVDLFNERFSSLFFDAYKVPSPYCYRCPLKEEYPACDIACIQPLDALLKKHAARIAAIILEPLVMCASGMIVYPKEYLEKAASLAKKYRVHLILDEVATGFGRTGKMFACQHIESIQPDFLCLSKGITAGYLPLAATLTSENVYRAFYADYEEKKAFCHGHTYTANPVSCSAALASLEVFKNESVLNRIQKLIPVLQDRLVDFLNLAYVGDVRGLGFIGAIELVKDKKTKRDFGFSQRLGLKVYRMGLAKNIVLRPLGNIIYLFLPLCVKEHELHDILDRTYSVLKMISV
jgi:adenosylmethionine-8-amino-7-oxononanoate aminotransferase